MNVFTTSIDIKSELSRLISPKRAWAFARKAGFVLRKGKLNPMIFLWTLALGFASGKVRCVSSLRCEYELASGTVLKPSSFYERFTPALVKYLRLSVTHLIKAVVGSTVSLSGTLAHFQDLMIADATVLRLYEFLASSFPGVRTNHSKAAAKLHVVMSATGVNPHTIALTSGRKHEVKKLKIGPWVRLKLLLLDLGYFSFHLFDRISRNGGYFISRMKTNADPLITKEFRRCRGRSIKMVGRRLRDVLPGLKRKTFDVEIAVEFRKRSYSGKQSVKTRKYRLVAVWNELTQKHHLYITNVPPEKLSAQDIALAYKARWEVELLFKAWKSQFRLDNLPSANKHVVEALIYASVITMLVSRKLLILMKQTAAPNIARRFTDGRIAVIVRRLAQLLLILVTTAPTKLAQVFRKNVCTLLFHEAISPHIKRPTLLETAFGIL